MAASKPRPKPIRPADEKIVYRYCDNVNCNYHASSLEKERNELDPGKPCPKCTTGKIQELHLVQAAGAPIGPATGWALPAPPYGGFLLQLGDDDATSTWGGAANTDARHQGAHYVAELQRDLLRLAFYGPARGGEKEGKYSTLLMAGVLDFKRHLVKEWGVTPSEDLSTVNANAKTAAKPEIYFPKDGLANPGEVYGAVTSWTQALGSTTSGVPGTLHRSYDSWVKLWEQSKAPQYQAIEKDPGMTAAVIVMADYTRKRFLSGVKEAQTHRTGLGKALTAQATARSSSTLDTAKVDKLQSEGKLLVSLINSLATDMPPAIKGTKRNDAELPPPVVGAADPAAPPYTMAEPPLASSGNNDRYDWAKSVFDQSEPILIAQDSVAKFIDVTVKDPSLKGSFAKRFEPFEKLIRARDAQTKLIEGLLGQLVTDVETAAGAAEDINKSVPGGTPRPDMKLAKQNALDHCDYWLRPATPAAPGPPPKPAKKAGPLDEFIDKLNAQDAAWTASGIALPDNWPVLTRQAKSLRSRVEMYRTNVSSSDSSTFMNEYIATLQTYGCVDAATARYIRTMVTDGKLDGRFVFRTPMGDELLPFKIGPDLPVIVKNEAAAAGLAGAPERLILSVFRHETGATHARTFGGIPFVMLGIDWATPKDRSHFVVESTSGRQLSFSRGWGISQTTLFTSKPGASPVYASAVPDPSLPGRFVAGPDRAYRTVSGIPMAEAGDSGPPIPLFIASGGGAANSGVKIFIGKFKASQKKRDCTFAAKKYDCANCVKNLQTGTPQLDTNGKPLKKGGMQFFHESEGDFERVTVGKSIASHRLRFSTPSDPKRLVNLIASGTYVIPGKTADTLTSDDADEFPCSWLTAITLYAGVGEIAWYYPLDRIDAIKNGTG